MYKHKHLLSTFDEMVEMYTSPPTCLPVYPQSLGNPNLILMPENMLLVALITEVNMY
jgi:hypothetical protein